MSLSSNGFQVGGVLLLAFNFVVIGVEVKDALDRVAVNC
jgi:hypothetical protein